MGIEKGKKPGRFNEDLDSASSTQKIPMAEYLNQSLGGTNKKIKVDLRTITNPAERE